LAGLVLALIAARYLEVTGSTLFGRSISLYWDGREFPTVAGQIVSQLTRLELIGSLLGIGLGLFLMFRLLKWLITLVLTNSATKARDSITGRTLTVFMVVFVGGNLAGLEATWPYVTRPLAVSWLHQIGIFVRANDPESIRNTLTPSPQFDADLSPIRGGDFYLVFIESLGMATLDDPELNANLLEDRKRLELRLKSLDASVVSTQVESPTFGGASWLAHAALMTGVDTRDHAHYDLLLTTERDNLVKLFSRNGYRTIAAIPGLRASWPEGKSFYRFDRLFDADQLNYRGPSFGYWRIPDQFTIAKLLVEESLSDRTHRPADLNRFVFAALVSSHIPFRPIPPYQPEWERLLTDHPFDETELEESLSEQPDWLNLRQPFVDSIRYSWLWLADLVELTRPANATLLVLGDHQPAASVAGKNQSWNVPVHLISSDTHLIKRARQLGFRPGLSPYTDLKAKPMHELTKDLLKLLDKPMQSLTC
jgi:hypothetical protein